MYVNRCSSRPTVESYIYQSLCPLYDVLASHRDLNSKRMNTAAVPAISLLLTLYRCYNVHHGGNNCLSHDTRAMPTPESVGRYLRLFVCLLTPTQGPWLLACVVP